MIIRRTENVQPTFPGDGAEGVELRKVIGEAEGARNFIMRVFRVSPGGHTPYHSHDFEHEIYILKGTGHVSRSGGGKEPLSEGVSIYIEPGEEHQFVNSGKSPLEFICVVPAPKKV